MLGAIFGKCGEYMKLDRDKSTFKSHRDFSSEKEITSFSNSYKAVELSCITTIIHLHCE